MFKKEEMCQVFYSSYLDILSITPILVIVIRRLDPPYERKGSVTPVTGIKPTTTLKLSIV